MLDKRKFPRLGKVWNLAYRKISSEEFKEELLRSITVNISGGGICFEAGEEIPEGTILALELESTAFPSPIIAVGKANWCQKQKNKDKYEVGVEFWWMGWQDLDAQQALAEYISKQTS